MAVEGRWSSGIHWRDVRELERFKTRRCSTRSSMGEIGGSGVVMAVVVFVVRGEVR